MFVKSDYSAEAVMDFALWVSRERLTWIAFTE